jgi:hypothetical protein
MGAARIFPVKQVLGRQFEVKTAPYQPENSVLFRRPCADGHMGERLDDPVYFRYLWLFA